MRGIFPAFRIIDQVQGPRGEQGPQGPEGPSGADGEDGSDGRDGSDANLPYRSGRVFGISIDVSSFASGDVRRTVDVAGAKNGDSVTWSYADGSAMPRQISNAGAFCSADGRVTFCFSVSSVLGLSLASIGVININAVWFR